MATVKVRLHELMEEKTRRDRLPRPLRQEDVAAATGIPQSTLSRWVGNKVDRLDKSILVKLCLYFECQIGDLLTFEME